jgi:ubiquitin C-terminal hydrolase
MSGTDLASAEKDAVILNQENTPTVTQKYFDFQLYSVSTNRTTYAEYNDVKYTNENIQVIKEMLHIKRNLMINGVANLGNTCYANALFQSLASTNDFLKYVKKTLITKDDENNNVDGANKKTAKYFKRVLEALKPELEGSEKTNFVSSLSSLLHGSSNINTRSFITKSINVKNVKLLLKNFKKFNIDVHQQNDSFELLQGIFEIFDELNDNQVREKDLNAPNNNDNNGETNDDKNGTNYRRNISPLSINEIDIRQCNTCNNVTNDKLTPNCYLSVNIKKNRLDYIGKYLPITATECLKAYFAKECIENYKCDKCNQISSVTKFRRLTSYPKILTMHFNRRMGGHIIRDKVRFEKTICLKDEWMMGATNDDDGAIKKTTHEGKKYKVKSIIKHISDMQGGGHYIAYRNVCKDDSIKIKRATVGDKNVLTVNTIKGRWIEANDDSLKEIKFSETVQQCEAYMAFFEAC